MNSNYLEVATAQLNRGFKVVPVHPLEKRGVLWNQYRQPATTVSEVSQHAKDFSDYNVGVVGVRGVGRHCFLDIDADGVVEQIQMEAGHKMPMTYTVQSSPAKKPWKRHFYFLQTEHSVRTFKKQFNRRDTTTTVTSDKGTLMHPTRYDFKGVGSGGFVVAAGCVRKDCERYTILQDAPVVPIPDWLVDWLACDQKRYLSECAKERRKQAESVTRIPDNARNARQAVGDPSAFPIREVDIHDFMLWRAGTFACLGIERRTIERLLIEQVTRFCAGGESYAKNHGDTIRNVAFGKRLHPERADVSWFYRIGERKKAGLRLAVPSISTKKGLLIAAMRRMPDRIPADEGYDRLQKALAGTEFTLDPGKGSQKILSEVRRASGFTTTRTSKGWVWVRSEGCGGSRNAS
jgi:hypothetical protein